MARCQLSVHYITSVYPVDSGIHPLNNWDQNFKNDIRHVRLRLSSIMARLGEMAVENGIKSIMAGSCCC